MHLNPMSLRICVDQRRHFFVLQQTRMREFADRFRKFDNNGLQQLAHRKKRLAQSRQAQNCGAQTIGARVDILFKKSVFGQFRQVAMDGRLVTFGQTHKVA